MSTAKQNPIVGQVCCLELVDVIGLGQKVAKTRYPKVLKKIGKAPEQYGSWDDDDADGEDDAP